MVSPIDGGFSGAHSARIDLEKLAVRAAVTHRGERSAEAFFKRRRCKAVPESLTERARVLL
jgi:hypothetical protein